MPSRHLRQAQAALERADWSTAYAEFRAVLQREESPEAMEGLAMAAWWLDEPAVVFEFREKAFQLYRRGGDRRSAGRVALALAEDHAYFRGETAIAEGWHRRARRLLEGLDLVPEHGWLKISEGDFALTLDRDPVLARELASEATSIGRQLSLLDLEMTGIALEGLSLVCEGKLRDGMPRLDEATAAAVSGEMEDYYAVGFAYCCLVQACELVRDFDRAAQWCEHAKEYAARVGLHVLSSYCRIQHASVFIWRGAWREAETELAEALRHLEKVRPPLKGEAIVRTAHLRRLQGRTDEAEALLSEADSHPLALLERAFLALDGGDPAAAARLASRFLRRADGTDITARLPAHEILFRAHLLRGDSEGCRETLLELRAVADALGTPPVLASLRTAEGLLHAAAGEADKARELLEEAVDLYGQSHVPVESGRTRLELARVLLSAGATSSAMDEARASMAIFSSLGAVSDAKRAEEFLSQFRTDRVRQRLTPREREVLRFISQGLSNPGIATHLHVSEFTVKRHVTNILAKLGVPTRAAAAAYAARHELV